MQLCGKLPLSFQAKGVYSTNGLIQVKLLMLNNLVYFHPAWLYLDLTSKIRDLNNESAHLYTSDQIRGRVLSLRKRPLSKPVLPFLSIPWGRLAAEEEWQVLLFEFPQKQHQRQGFNVAHLGDNIRKYQ